MTIRFLTAILATILLAPMVAPASTLPALDLRTVLAGEESAPQQCLPPLCPFRVADDTVIVPDSCDASVQSQCINDCQVIRSDCETGHEDNLPCEPNYTTCASNCAVMAGCSN